MNQIISKELINVRYVLGSTETAKGFYNQIKGTFPQNHEYRIFAEPIVLTEGHKISWATEYDGSIINYKQLSPEDQSRARDMLSMQMKKLFDAAKGFSDNTLVDFLYKCIEIPGMDDIFIVKTPEQEKVVITQWGFTLDTPGAEKGLLEKIINAKKVDMIFNVIYADDETSAPDTDVHFENEGKKFILKSDKGGYITLSKVKVDSYVKAWEVIDDQIINMHSFTCYEFGKYLIKVTRKADMRFKVITSAQKILPNETFTFTYNGKTETLTSGADGTMLLPAIAINTEVKAYQISGSDEINLHRFICAKDTSEYLIVIKVPEEVVVAPEVPKVYDMKFKVVDNTGELVTNAKIVVTFNKQTKTLFTDEQGFAVLPNVEPGTQVKVKATGKKNKKK